MKTPPRVSFVPLLPLLVVPFFAASAGPVQAQSIQRCTAPDGTSIFTDKGCAAFGARLAEELDYSGRTIGSDVDGAFADVGADGLRPVPVNLGDSGAMSTGFAMKGCARTQGELIAGVRAAVASGDVNRLSNYYHWTGTSNSTAYALMERLDRIARNTLAGVQFDYPLPEPERYDYAAATAPDDGAAGAYPEPRVYYASRVALGDRPSTFAAHRPVDADVAAYGAGIVDASTPLSEAKPAVPAEPTPTGPAAGLGARYAPTAPVLTGMVDASTPLDEARASTLAYSSGNAYNPQPVALRVNMGGGTGARFNLRQNAGCWFISF